MVQAIRAALTSELARDPKVVLLGQDIGRMGGVFRATEGLHERFGGDRVIDMPIAEASMVGAAVGLAAAGMRPVVEIQFLGFAHLAFHQIAHQLARMRYRSQGRIHCPVTIRCPYGGGVRALEIHSDAAEAMYAQVPGLKVIAPATARDARDLLQASIRDDDPVLFLEPLKGYRLVSDEVPDEAGDTPLGLARIARSGADITLITWSGMVPLAERAAQTLAADGIDAEVIDLRSITPLDVATLGASVRKTGRAVVIQEGPLSGGFGAEIVATLVEEAFFHLEAPVGRVAAPDVPYPFATALEEYFMPGETQIINAVKKVMAA